MADFATIDYSINAFLTQNLNADSENLIEYYDIQYVRAKQHINALKKIDNSIYLLGGDHLTGMEKILEEYKNYNPAIESIMIPDTKHLPQLEAPAAFHEMCETFLE